MTLLVNNRGVLKMIEMNIYVNKKSYNETTL